MPRFESAPVDLLGLDEKIDPRHKAIGSLKVADNVVIDKKGCFKKRRGYSMIDLRSATIEAITDTEIDDAHVGLATLGDELIVFGYDHVYSVASYTAGLGGSRAIRRRGKWPRGNISIVDVVGGIAGQAEPAA